MPAANLRNSQRLSPGAHTVFEIENDHFGINPVANASNFSFTLTVTTLDIQDTAAQVGGTVSTSTEWVCSGSSLQLLKNTLVEDCCIFSWNKLVAIS